MEKQKKNLSNKQQKKRCRVCKIKIDAKKELGLSIKKEDKYTIPIFIPHRGCKNECVFCNQRKISGELKVVNVDDVDNKIKEFLEYYHKENKKIEIAFFGGSFTGLDIEEQEEFLSVAQKYVDGGMVTSIRLSTRPDYIDNDILDMLKKYNVETIELGVQSMDDEVLRLSKRGHTKNDVIKASLAIKEKGFKLGHQVMVGLPGSNAEKEQNTAKESISMKPDCVRIYPVYVLKESELWDMQKNGSYNSISLHESVERTTNMYREYVKNSINVIRVGLQVTEEINQKNENVRGPICDNYRERVLSEIMKQVIIAKINNVKKTVRYRLIKPIGIQIIVPSTQINYAVGNNKCNLKFLNELFEEKIKMKIN